VQRHDVAVPDPGSDRGQVVGEDTFIVRPLGAVEGSTVTRVAVEDVVQPLGDGEEFGVAVEDEPAVVDQRGAPVGERVCSISATPPPRDVALMCQIGRSRKAARARRPVSAKVRTCSPVRTLIS
jgi:hypothetical protein